VEEAESSPETELYSVTYLKEAAHPKPPLTGTVTLGKDQEQPFYIEVDKAVTREAPDG